MRLLRPLPTVLALFLVVLLLAPAVWAAPPQPMDFNGRPSSQLPGAVTGLAVDGVGKWGAVSVADGGTTVTTEDRDLYVYSLDSQGRAWEALDEDLVNDGARMVAVAAGTAGQEGQWIVLANTSVPAVITGYRSSGFSAGKLGKLVWQFSPSTGTVRDMALNADGQVIALATEGTSASPSSVVRAAYLVLKNRQSSSPPLTLYRGDAGTGAFDSVTAFTATAVASNTSVGNADRPVYSVVGAETELGGGALFILEHVFAGGSDSATTHVLFTIDTGNPVTKVAMTSDGEYALAGTQGGVLYLVSVREALQRKGVQGLGAEPLRPWQGSLASRIRSLDIAPLGGAFFAAGTDTGEVAAYRNQRNPVGSQGAQALEVGAVPVAAVPCGGTTPRGPVGTMAISSTGDHLVAGARNGVLGFEVGAVEQGRPGPLPAAWCFPLPSSDVQGSGVLVDMSGDGTRVFAASQSQVYGYRNFYQFGLAPDAERKSGTPGQRVQWVVSLSNDGSLFDRVNLGLACPPADQGWSCDISPSSVALLPGASRPVLVNVTTPPDIVPANITLVLTAKPENAGADAQVSVPLRLDLGRLRRVEVVVPPGVLVASPGIVNKFPLTLHNSGNAQDRFRVSAEIPEPVEVNKSPGSEWQVRVNPFEVDVPARGDATVDLEVTPTAANRGDTANIRIRVEAASPDAGGAVVDEKTVMVAVEPEYRADIALREARDHTVEPGGLVFINLTVKNLGNTRDIFFLKNRSEPCTPSPTGCSELRNWKLQISDERFELRTKDATKIVRLGVSAKTGLQPQESVKIVVELFSEGLKRQIPGSDGQVDTQSVVVTVVAKQRSPFVAEPLLLLAVVALALAARRRGS